MSIAPIDGCPGCAGTAGVWGCPTHSPKMYVQYQPKINPFAIIHLRCPHCGKDMEMECFKVVEKER